MDTTTLILAAVAVILLGFAYWRERGLPQAGLLAAGQTLWRNLPILLLGFAIAGLVQVLVSADLHRAEQLPVCQATLDNLKPPLGWA